MSIGKIMALGLVLGAAIIMAKIGFHQSTLPSPVVRSLIFLVGIVLLLFLRSDENEVR